MASLSSPSSPFQPWWCVPAEPKASPDVVSLSPPLTLFQPRWCVPTTCSWVASVSPSCMPQVWWCVPAELTTSLNVVSLSPPPPSRFQPRQRVPLELTTSPSVASLSSTPSQLQPWWCVPTKPSTNVASLSPSHLLQPWWSTSTEPTTSPNVASLSPSCLHFVMSSSAFGGVTELWIFLHNYIWVLCHVEQSIFGLCYRFVNFCQNLYCGFRSYVRYAQSTSFHFHGHDTERWWWTPIFEGQTNNIVRRLYWVSVQGFHFHHYTKDDVLFLNETSRVMVNET